VFHIDQIGLSPLVVTGYQPRILYGRQLIAVISNKTFATLRFMAGSTPSMISMQTGILFLSPLFGGFEKTQFLSTAQGPQWRKWRTNIEIINRF
jgi:hypothetical protein